LADLEAIADDLFIKNPAPNLPISVYFQSVMKKKTAQRALSSGLLSLNVWRTGVFFPRSPVSKTASCDNDP
jgi:hypothetical protein